MEKVIVIGGGVAGFKMSAELKKKMKDKVEVINFRPEEKSVIPCSMPYAIEGLFDYKKAGKNDKMLLDPGVKLIKKRVKGVDFGAKKVFDEEGKSYEWDKLVIATGSKPFVPPIEGANLSNVMQLKFYDDMVKIIERIENGAKKALVIGAGAIGNETAVAFARRGLETYVVEMQDRIFPTMLDPDFVDDLHKEYVDNGVKLLLNARLERLEGDNYAKKAIIKLKNGETKEIELNEEDIVLFAVGFRANVDIFKDSPLFIGRDGIKVDGKMQTNIKDVYAIGDATEFYSAIDLAPMPGKLASNAIMMAKTLIYNLLGFTNITHKGFINTVGSELFETKVASVGFSETFAKMRGFEPVSVIHEGTTKFPFMPGCQTIKVKLIADRQTKRIIGAQLKGTYAVAEWNNIIGLLIQQKATVYDLFDFNYTSHPNQSFLPGFPWLRDAATMLMTKLK